MPINANHSNAALNQFSRSLNLLDSSLKNTTQFNMTFSPSTLPFISSDNVKTSSGPDQIYIDILSSTRFWVQRIASPLVIIIGVIGNSMTIVIMTRKRMRSSTNVYLAALATVDMLYLTFTFILSIKHYPGINRPTPVTRLYWRLLPILMMAADACTNCSVWLTAAFTIERFIVVSNPIRGKALCTESRARAIAIFIFAFCTAFVIPVPFEWKIIEKEDDEKIQKLQMETSELGANSTYKSIYYWLTSVLFIFIPLIFLIVFNSFLIRSVHISRKERAQMTNTQTTKSSLSSKKKKTKTESKQQKNKKDIVCELQLDANNNDNPSTSNNLGPNLNLKSGYDSNTNIINGNQQKANTQLSTANNLQPSKNLTRRRPSENASLESRPTSASSPTTATAIKTSTVTPNRIEQQSSKQETKITIMLIAVVILFLVCQLPVAINLIYTSIRNIDENSNEFYIVYTFNNILNLMVALNAAGNFVLYCLLSQKYRKTLVTLFCPCFKPKRLRKCNTQQATIYSTLTTTNQYHHHSPSSTTGFQSDKSPNRVNALNEQQIKRSNEYKANKLKQENDAKTEAVKQTDEDISKQKKDDVKLSND